MSTTYEHPQFDAAPDDTTPTLDTRHPSTLGRVRVRARAVPRKPVDARRITTGTATFDNAVSRVDGIGEKAKPPTYGRYVPPESVMLGRALNVAALILLAVAVAYFYVHGLDTPAHLLPR